MVRVVFILLFLTGFIKSEVNADSSSNEEILDIIKSLQQSHDEHKAEVVSLKAEVALLKAENNKIDILKEQVTSCNEKLGSVMDYFTEYNHILNDNGSVKITGPLNRVQDLEGFAEQDRNKRALLEDTPTSYPRYAFSAYLNHILDNVGQEETIIYNQVLLNEGGAYNNIIGIFTVPVSGIYLFSWSSAASQDPAKAAYEVSINLMVNNYRLTTTVAQSSGSWDDNQGSNVAIVHVNKGDVVFTKPNGGGKVLFGDVSLRVTTFSGVLLYVD